MKKYLSFFRIRSLNGLQYRAAAAAGIATQFAWGFLLLLLYQAFYRADASAFPMTQAQLASYIWLQQAFLALFNTWGIEGDILNAVATGSIGYELCRPASLYGMWITRSAANRASRCLLRCIPVLAVVFLLPEPFRMGPPAGAGALGLFLLTAVLGGLVASAYCLLVPVLSFYTVSPLGVRMALVALADLLAGGLIPLPFFPDWLRPVLELLPYAAMQNVPLRVYSGQLAGPEALRALLLQLFWAALLLLLGWGLTRRALRRVVVQGG